MGSSPIMHPRLLGALTPRFYPSSVSIQSYTATRATDGGEVKTWAIEACWSALRCAISGSGGYEVKRADSTIATSSHRIAIAGYYPTIAPKMRAVDNDTGDTFDILSVASDSHIQTTSLVCQIVT